MATIYVIDDDVSVRESLTALLTETGLRAVPFASAEEFLQSEPIERPSCVLLDVVLGGMSGLELQGHLLENNIYVPVVMISAFANVSMAVQAMEAGALTVIEKPCKEHLLSRAVRTAIECDRQQFELDQMLQTYDGCASSLTSREKSVLDKVLAGKPNKVIANSLDVSERTIEGDRAKILRKFSTDNAVELAAKYTEYQMLVKRRYRKDCASVSAGPAAWAHPHRVMEASGA